MTTHAKASSAGPTLRQASRLGRIVRRAFATRGASSDADGSGAPSAAPPRLLARPATRRAASVALFAALLAGLVFGITSAFATPAAPKTIVNTLGSVSGSTGGLFSFPRGVAVNQTGAGGVSAGTFYVSESGNRRVQRISPTASFVSAWGWGVRDGEEEYERCNVAASCRQALAGTGAGEFGSAGLPAANGAQGLAVDQATGNVYVSDQTDRRIDILSATGVFEGSFGWGVRSGAAALEFCTSGTGCLGGLSGSGGGEFGAAIGGLAVSGGKLYVADKTSRRIDVFKPTFTGNVVTGIEFEEGFGWDVNTGGVTGFETCTTGNCKQGSAGTGFGQFASSSSPQDVAVDSEGNVFALDFGNKRVEEFNSNPEPTVESFGLAALSGTFGATGERLGLAITEDHLYVLGRRASLSNRLAVEELDHNGNAVATHGTDITTSGTGLTGVAAASASLGGNIYVASNSGGQGVYVLNEPPTMEPVSVFTDHTAIFKGEVVSNNIDVKYHFEYSTDGASWTKLPITDVDAGTAPGKIPVEQEATGLIGSQLYHVRLVQNRETGGGSTTSTEAAFITTPAKPVITRTAVSTVTTTTARLEASINPENQSTMYHFEYGTGDCSLNPCTSLPATDTVVGEEGVPVAVSNEATGLEPDTTYHFRAVATNGSGETQGPDRTFSTYPATGSGTSCPNDALRLGSSSLLPDCRAYEMVSPVEKGNGGVIQVVEINSNPAALDQSSTTGGKFTYSFYRAFGDAESAPYVSQYLVSRAEGDGWTTQDISPTRGTPVVPGTPSRLDTEYKAFSEDLSFGWLFHEFDPPLVAGALEGFPNLYKRDNETGTYEALTTVQPPYLLPVEFTPEFQGFATSGNRAIFRVADKLTPDAPELGSSATVLYEWTPAGLHLVSILPNGTPSLESASAGTANSLYPDRTADVTHAISTDGSHIFWTASSFSEGPGKLYVRVNGTETIAVSESVSADPARFWLASADGSTAIFTVDGNLYSFDVGTETATPIANDGSVLGVMGASEDASYVYFVAEGELASGATGGQPNLYLFHEGALTFVATLSSIDATAETGIPSDVNVEPINRTSRVTPSGLHAIFMSTRSLTGYDNTDVNSGEADSEVYTYDASTETLRCASCNPSGAQPTGRNLLVRKHPSGLWVAGRIPTWENQLYDQRSISNNGSRVFFDSYDALLPQDTNGKQDVYEWEADGEGSCERAAGCLSLISTGESTSDSEFVDASGSGNDVFITTASGLVSQDPGLIDVYDARVNGGFPQPPPGPSPCEGDSCQSPPAPPNDPTPSSATFSGPGNSAPAKKKHRKHRHHRRHHRRHAKHRIG